MPDSDDDRRVIDYATPPQPPPAWPRRPLTVNEFGCALVAVLYGIPLLMFLIFLMIAFSERD